ncbi:MAG TPA: hypothetical protein VGF23_13635 [Gaiellaceae bacterium]
MSVIFEALSFETSTLVMSGTPWTSPAASLKNTLAARGARRGRTAGDPAETEQERGRDDADGCGGSRIQ